MMFINVYFFLILDLFSFALAHNIIGNSRNNINSHNINNNNNYNNHRSIWTRFKLITEPNYSPKIMQTGRLNEEPKPVYKVIQNKDNKTEVKFITLDPDSNLVIHSKHYNSSVNISSSGREKSSERRRVPMGSVQLTKKPVNTTNKINVNTESPQQSKIAATDHLMIVNEIGRRRRRPPIIRDPVEAEEEDEEEDEDDDDDDYGISEVTETVEEDLEEDDDDDDDDDDEEVENEETLEVPEDAVIHKVQHQPQYAVIPQPVFVHQSTKPVAVPKRTRKHKLGRGKHKIKRRLKKFMLPLLLAYKLKFLILVPLLMGALVLIVGTTGFAGFFFALFVVGLGLQKKWS